MTTLKNEKINYVSADDGKIELHYVENGVNQIKSSDNPAILASVIQEIGLSKYVMSSSALDFASDFGFKNDDDAKKLYKQAINLI